MSNCMATARRKASGLRYAGLEVLSDFANAFSDPLRHSLATPSRFGTGPAYLRTRLHQPLSQPPT